MPIMASSESLLCFPRQVCHGAYALLISRECQPRGQSAAKNVDVLLTVISKVYNGIESSQRHQDQPTPVP